MAELPVLPSHLTFVFSVLHIILELLFVTRKLRDKYPKPKLLKISFLKFIHNQMAVVKLDMQNFEPLYFGDI